MKTESSDSNPDYDGFRITVISVFISVTHLLNSMHNTPPATGHAQTHTRKYKA
ncbi:hypothetical protein AB7W15_17175 [Morganella morganii]|uniref:hypothetical protein n=1 Tax=Morganella TaxID=581 RepID=UPI000B1BDE0F|nr:MULTISPECIES: hypothetical protein [Morganella]MDM8752054.1 hypothetical protein [Morganella morganii]